MLYHFPFRNEDRSEIRKIAEVADGESVCIKATVFSEPTVRRVRKNLAIYTLILRDDSGFINAVWYNNKYIMNCTFSASKYPTYQSKIENDKRYKLYSANEISKDLIKLIDKYQIDTMVAHNGKFDYSMI